jgi:type II secretory pathway predicted ATPase ExeA
MTDQEGRQYVAHRIERVGGNPAIISDQAVRLLVAASDGIPRVINAMCDLALVYGYSAERNPVDVRIVRQVLEDRQSMGLGSDRLAGSAL